MLWPRRLAEDIGAIAPDIVHTHGGVWYKASLAARLARVPWIVHTDHGRIMPDPWRSRWLHRLASRRTDAIVAVSEPLAAYLAARVVSDASRSVTIVNGVDTDLWRPARSDAGALRRELGLDADVPILGSIGRLQPIKGYDVMVDAYARLRAGWRAPVHARACGRRRRPRPCGSLQEAGDRLGLDGLFLLGWRDDIPAFHLAFTLFTMSSRSEGTSVSLLEAMSAGLCPVVTDVGGNRLVLGPELAHRLVPRREPERPRRGLGGGPERPGGAGAGRPGCPPANRAAVQPRRDGARLRAAVSGAGRAELSRRLHGEGLGVRPVRRSSSLRPTPLGPRSHARSARRGIHARRAYWCRTASGAPGTRSLKPSR